MSLRLPRESQVTPFDGVENLPVIRRVRSFQLDTQRQRETRRHGDHLKRAALRIYLHPVMLQDKALEPRPPAGKNGDVVIRFDADFSCGSVQKSGRLNLRLSARG